MIRCTHPAMSAVVATRAVAREKRAISWRFTLPSARARVDTGRAPAENEHNRIDAGRCGSGPRWGVKSSRAEPHGSRRQGLMKNRRTFLMMLTAGFVALTVLVAPVIADELFGVISKVNIDAKKLTVIEKGTDKEIEISVTDDTEYVTGKGSSKIDLEKVAKTVEKIQ